MTDSTAWVYHHIEGAILECEPFQGSWLTVIMLAALHQMIAQIKELGVKMNDEEVKVIENYVKFNTAPIKDVVFRQRDMIKSLVTALRSERERVKEFEILIEAYRFYLEQLEKDISGLDRNDQQYRKKIILNMALKKAGYLKNDRI